MERTFKATLYLLGYGDCGHGWDPIEEAEGYELDVVKYSNAYKMRFEEKSLNELEFFERKMNYAIQFFGYVKGYGTESILHDWMKTIDTSKLKDNLKLVRGLINELRPRKSRVTRKDVRKAKAKLNRSYGRGKNK